MFIIDALKKIFQKTIGSITQRVHNILKVMTSPNYFVCIPATIMQPGFSASAEVFLQKIYPGGLNSRYQVHATLRTLIILT